MTIRHQIELETVFSIIVAASLSSFFVWRSNQNYQTQFHVAVPVIAANNTQTAIAPILDPVLKMDTASQVSPDGTKKLVMKTAHNTDGTLTYVFTTTDGSGTSEQQLYTATVKGSESMSIPFNTWSPDNRFLFIQKNGTQALVFKATGEPIAPGQAYFDVPDVFRERSINNTFHEATGWASPTLLIINTITADNSKGPSYWFEVPTKAIIQLSSQF